MPPASFAGAEIPRSTSPLPVDSASSPAPPTADNPASLSTAAKFPLSPVISVELHGTNNASNNLSPPAHAPYQSPMRQHRRTPSQHREVKETLNAVAQIADEDDDGPVYHKINQYTILHMIGRGSYGSVHLATDQSGQEYAIKEFSKQRMKRRARTQLMKRGPFRASPGGLDGPSGFGMPGRPGSGIVARLDRQSQAEADDALHYIREEVAIMKKLNHLNLVQLIEVLDDPDQDSLYMVMEMCKKGVIMDVDLGKTAKPYSAEESRLWFRDLILGIEYLHQQKIIHRDIKPDNLLISDDDVLKIADFGVSEMFEKEEEMRTTKSAGSPAFLPPELCVAGHGDVAGPPCDIWAMGVTLYCLRYGKIPFERDTAPEMYEAINTSEAVLAENEDEHFVDLMRKILNKDPSQRITMPELREHPWITNNGTDLLVSTEENCAPIEPPNALEVNHAFTRRMNHLLCVLRAIRKFKSLLHSNKPSSLQESSLAEAATPTPTGEQVSSTDPTEDEVKKLVLERRRNMRKATRDKINVLQMARESASTTSFGIQRNTVGSSSTIEPERQRPEAVILGIGAGGGDEFSNVPPAEDEFVSESPTATDFDVYDRAFQSEVERIQHSHLVRTSSNRSTTTGRNTQPTMYKTKVLEERNAFRDGSQIPTALPLSALGNIDNTAHTDTVPPTPANAITIADSAGPAGPAGPKSGGVTETPAAHNLALADVVEQAMEGSLP